jgi:EmrB/QacA subfamily drug resistance transporter
MNTVPAPDQLSEGHPERWIGLGVLLLAGFMNLIDVTIVNVALPRLQAGFNATSSQIEWVVAAYVLAFALGLLPLGRLGDAIGRKRMFLIGITSFTLFSAFCGMAPSMSALIVFRLFQGLSGAMMMPQVLAIVQVMFPPQERAFAFSFFGLTAGLASVAGPLTGGLLINADIWGLDWRPIFLVNIPIGIATVFAGRALIPDLPGHPNLKHDIVGILLAGLSLVALIYPLIEGHVLGWPVWTFAMMAAAFVGFAAFYAHERRQNRLGLSELLPVSLIADRNFLIGTFMTLVFFSGVAGFFMVLAVFLQTGFGFTPLQSGLTTVPFPAGVLVASLISGRLGGRWPRRRVAVGSLIVAAGMALLALRVSQIGNFVDHWQFLLPLFVAGVGLGIGIASLFQTVLANVPHRDAGAGAGALQSFQQVGGALGIAVSGQIFFSTLAGHLAQQVAPHTAFVSSMSNTLVFEISAFVLVAAMVFLLPKRSQTPASRQGSATAEM